MSDNKEKQGPTKNYHLAYRVGIEFVSGIFVGVLLGYVIDHYFSTKPWGLIIFILLGAGAGFRNIFRLARHDQSKVNSDSVKKDRSSDD
ncbi:AtpZ/AtpI family protein [Candidatus Paracaedibacter symbiosus]|uniref:AtpZ/AtpI family protein n=1 Tax=Candidatus Paracaedibacter symbiosus TaxID=244582 RepID=UPI00068E2310|nr:AtpZ/AtpI family protein [Candidatus Paracaedibacter symbiosus]